MKGDAWNSQLLCLGEVNHPALFIYLLLITHF